MFDRASTFSHPEIVRLLRTEFVPVAIDQAYQRRQQDAEGRFYQKIANQGPRKVGEGTTQGRYLATAGGELLGYNNNRDPARLLKLMEEALERFEPVPVEPLEAGAPDRRYVHGPPEGGLAVRVNSRVLGGYGEAGGEHRRIFQEGLGRDNFWVRRDEHEALLRGELPESLVERLARFHLVDNTRGEPPMWARGDIRENTLALEDGVLRGRIHLRTDAGDREFRAELLGRIEAGGGDPGDAAVTRFDLVARGLFRGEGRFTRGAPEGDFPFAVAFRLADGSDPADTIPPQGGRGWLDGYLR